MSTTTKIALAVLGTATIVGIGYGIYHHMKNKVAPGEGGVDPGAPAGGGGGGGGGVPESSTARTSAKAPNLSDTHAYVAPIPHKVYTNGNYLSPIPPPRIQRKQTTIPLVKTIVNSKTIVNRPIPTATATRK